MYTNGESEIAIKVPFKHTMENGSGLSNSTKGSTNGTRRDEEAAESGNETENENDDNENNENDEEEEEDDDDDDQGPYTPFDPPCKKFLCFYLSFLNISNPYLSSFLKDEISNLEIFTLLYFTVLEQQSTTNNVTS